MAALRELILLEKDWIPASKGASLYIRPTMVATEPGLGVRPAKQYLFFVILSPVGAYYPEGFNPVKIFVTDKYVRAMPGGVGHVKTAGNYAASIMAAVEAQRQGFTQVLWLDARERKYIEEVGTMNIFFVLDDEVVTPPLTGSILPGITRQSVLQLLRDWGLQGRRAARFHRRGSGGREKRQSAGMFRHGHRRGYFTGGLAGLQGRRLPHQRRLRRQAGSQVV